MKKRGKAIASMMKSYGRINNPKAHGHKKGKHGLGRKMWAFAPSNAQSKKG